MTKQTQKAGKMNTRVILNLIQDLQRLLLLLRNNMRADEYSKFRCWAYSQSSSVSKKICSQINSTGGL